MKRLWLAAGAVAAAMCAHGDSVGWVEAPGTVRVGRTSSVTVAYSVDEPSAGKALYVGVSRSGSPNEWLGVARRPVSGAGTAAMEFRVDVPPAEGASYSLMARAVRELDGPAEVTAEAAEQPVTVIADRLGFLQVPPTVQNGQTAELLLAYCAESNTQLKVDLLKPGAPVGEDWFGGGTINVASGCGTGRVEVTVQGYPALGPDYHWNAMLSPDGTEARATAVAAHEPVLVLEDRLEIVEAPASVSPNEMVQVGLSYFVFATPGGKHAKVNLLNPGAGYAWHGGGDVPVGWGNGTTTVPFQVQDDPASGTGYVLDSFIARNGHDWDRATAHDQAPVEVRADSVAFHFYPADIWTPQFWTVQIAYDVRAQRKIRVDLLTPAPDYTWRGGSEVLVDAGSGIANVVVHVPDTFPSGWHFWAVYAAPPGGSYDDRTASAASGPVWVTRDPVHIVGAPTQVQAGVTCDVTLSWEVMQASEVHVDLVRDGVYTWHGGAWMSIPEGTGTNTFRVTVNASTPAGTNYLWSSWVGPAGQGYENRTADDVWSGIVVAP